MVCWGLCHAAARVHLCVGLLCAVPAPGGAAVPCLQVWEPGHLQKATVSSAKVDTSVCVLYIL